jgi:hypothetical protein
LSIRREFFSEIHDWAVEVEHLLSEAVHICDLDPGQCENPSFFNRKHEIRCKISAVLDQGRWYFPNEKHDEHGTQKETAFKGFRQIPLNHIDSAYKLVGTLDYKCKEKNANLRVELVSIKRGFSSEIQRTLDPRRREQEFKMAVGDL